MLGIFKLALKLLTNDRGKFSALLMGITFAVFLMVMMMSMFSGILSRASSSIDNVGAQIWVLDPAVNNVSSSIPMPDYVLDYAKSIKGVKHAEPISGFSNLSNSASLTTMKPFSAKISSIFPPIKLGLP